MGLALLVDDGSFSLSAFTGTQWSHETGQNSEFNGTVSTCRVQSSSGQGKGTGDSDSSTPPNLSFSFYGSDIIFYGTLTSGVAMNYTIDKASPRPAVFNSSSPGKPGVEIFGLNGLSKTTLHTLKLFPSAGQFTFDYITYTPTASTGLAGSNLIIDDQNSLVKYSSGWTKSKEAEYVTGVPYLRTVTGTSTPGSSMTFDFIGSSISVMGVLQQASGSLTASFSVDAGTPIQYTPFSGSQTVNATSWALSQQLFQQDLLPGTHTLKVSLDEVSGAQVLWIDALVFEGTSGTSLTGAIGSSTNSSGHFKFPPAAIGGIIAAFFIIAIILGIYYRRKTRRGNQELTMVPPEVTSGSYPKAYNKAYFPAISNYNVPTYNVPEVPITETALSNAAYLRSDVAHFPIGPTTAYSTQYQDPSSMSDPWRNHQPSVYPIPTPLAPLPHRTHPHASQASLTSQPLPVSHNPQNTTYRPQQASPPASPPAPLQHPTTIPSLNPQWESTSTYAPSSSQPPPSGSSNFAGVQHSNEKGITTLQWQPTVRNPSPEPQIDANAYRVHVPAAAPQAGRDHEDGQGDNTGMRRGRETDARPREQPPAYDPNLYIR